MKLVRCINGRCLASFDADQNPTCPSCGTFTHEPQVSPQASPQASAKSEPPDPRSGRKVCVTCGFYPASVSESTTGDGPWYCRVHFPLFKSWNDSDRQLDAEEKRRNQQRLDALAQSLPGHRIKRDLPDVDGGG